MCRLLSPANDGVRKPTIDAAGITLQNKEGSLFMDLDRACNLVAHARNLVGDLVEYQRWYWDIHWKRNLNDLGFTD